MTIHKFTSLEYGTADQIPTMVLKTVVADSGNKQLKEASVYEAIIILILIIILIIIIIIINTFSLFTNCSSL